MPCPYCFEGRNVNMARYTREQIESVRQTDMVDFLANEYGWTIVKVGNCYSTQEHDSIRIRPDRKLWYWNSQKVGGANVISWLQKVENMNFSDIMSKMLGVNYNAAEITKYRPKKTNKNKQENLDENGNPNRPKNIDENGNPIKHNGKYTYLFAYLTKSRCISPSIVNELIKSHRIYQDIWRNVIFVNPNEKGEIGFWCSRGTNTQKKFTGNKEGFNNPYYGFTLEAKCDCDTLYVFESPIDLLSHCTIADLKYGEGSWHNLNRIALCGVSDTALKFFLDSHKNITTIKLCLDNDYAGWKANLILKSQYCELGYKIQLIHYNNVPKKDINEILCDYINQHQEKNTAQSSKNKSNVSTEYISDETTEENIIEERPPIASSAHRKQNNMDYMGRY